MNDSLKNGGIYVGCLKPKCKTLFDFDGTPSGFTLQPGDVLDDIADFQKACEMGGYQLVEHEPR